MGTTFNQRRIGNSVMPAFLFTFLYLPLAIFAQGGTLSISLSSDHIHLNDIIKIEIKVENSEGNIEIPQLENFQIISGPNVSSQMSSINGIKSQKKAYTLLIQAKEVGDFFVEETYLTDGEKVHTLNSIKVVVDPPVGIGEKTNISYANEYKATIDLNSGEIMETEQKLNSEMQEMNKENEKPKRIKKRF